MHPRRIVSFTAISLGLAFVLVLAAGPFFTTVSQVAQNLYIKTKILTMVLDKVQRYYVDEVDPGQLVEDAIKGMLSGLDPHTVYLTKEDFDKWRVDFEGYHGIGISYDIIRNKITVLTVNEDGPACAAGLQPGDRIVKVNGESVVGIKREEVPLKLMGPAGSTVTVTVERQGWDRPRDFTLTRRQITLASVPYAFMLAPEVGYVRIARFTGSTVNELDNSLRTLFGQGMKRLILDLRGNTGGYLQAAEQVADRFLPGGKIIVYTRGRVTTSRQEFISTDQVTVPVIPMVVLIDHASASGAEIVAGALQDWDRALLVGQTSFGKGLVQTEFPFQDGSALLVTTARYYTPSGRLIQREFARRSREEYFAEAGYQDQAAPEEERPRPAYQTSLGRTVYGGGGITPDVVVKPETRQLSAAFRRLFFAQERFFYTFCESYAASHPELGQDLERYLQEFTVSEQMCNSFLQHVRKSGFAFSDSEYQHNKTDIQFALKRELAFIFWGDVGRYRVAMQLDNQLKAALEQMPQAERLLSAKSFRERNLPRP
ncbi:MAG: S41 family peptidase [candidate division KSB1 bacterium]|nr:S41 family peptidase [candidate division KSB1 bacterium]